MDIIAQSKWFTLALTDEGEEIVQCTDAVIIVARDDEGRILLIEEPSYAFADTTLLFPGGVVEPRESVLDAAQRELREETGFGAHHLAFIGAIRPWSKYLQVSTHVVFAQSLFSAPLTPDESYAIPLRRMSYPQVREAIAGGVIKDASVIAGLTLCFDGDGEPLRTFG